MQEEAKEAPVHEQPFAMQHKPVVEALQNVKKQLQHELHILDEFLVQLLFQIYLCVQVPVSHWDLRSQISDF